MPAGRPRLLAVLAAALVVAVAAALMLLLTGGDDEPDAPPAARATALIPADALVYLHLSTDAQRPGTREAEAIARRFPGFARVRDDVVRRVTAPSCGVRPADVRGAEAALAFLDTGGGTAGSLVLLDTGREPQGTPRDRQCGPVQTARIGRFLAVGQPQTLQLARELARGKGRSLAQQARYRRATAQLPADRVADGWVSREGVARLLAPRGGLLGGAGTLLAQPGLVGAAIAVSPREDGALLTVRSALERPTGAAGTFRPFTPRLQDTAPRGALAYLAVSGVSGGLARIADVAGGSFAGLGPLLVRARRELARQTPGLQRDLLDLFRGEVGLTLTPGLPAPTLTVAVAARDRDATAAALRRVEAPLARILAPSGGPTPRWTRADGVASLRLTAGIEVHYAVDEGRVLIATRRDGVLDARSADGGLADSDAWRAVLGNGGKPTTSLVFLDLSQLLRLAEQTGLNDDRAYQAVRDDLVKVRAIGARSSGSADESTAEILLSIP
ncbi:hypothetical protein [Paraconexibacter algicola]|uniref:DUF3352 domain-containing protein n=1 Tax=Paraconexibacter algicola TaxID=2133960 RepID=A0A2T4UDC2_9ACTN|nr:hypothetical protein [Paraconexibacter algicola]PTL55442.1 hypothetical protein C7Y72_17445 [Paraconexibacter algicola]